MAGNCLVDSASLNLTVFLKLRKKEERARVQLRTHEMKLALPSKSSLARQLIITQ